MFLSKLLSKTQRSLDGTIRAGLFIILFYIISEETSSNVKYLYTNAENIHIRWGGLFLGLMGRFL